MIDSHAHLLTKFMDNVETAITNAQKTGLKAIINSAIEVSHYQEAIELENSYRGFIFTTMGFAPSWIKKLNIEETIENIRKFKTIVGVGEVGLDYYWIKEVKWIEKEKEAFVKLIQLANDLSKPLIIHSRKAESDCIQILEKKAQVPVLMHCFAGTMEDVKNIIEHDDWLISIPTAVVNRKKHRKIANKTPLEHLVVETDSPFLSPVQGEKNEPMNVKFAISEIAKIKDVSFEEVDKITTLNAKKFYALPI